ncbi:hypothetical protein DV735_g4791, partial [Chaetothyriales sp. CBS 134920]
MADSSVRQRGNRALGGGINDDQHDDKNVSKLLTEEDSSFQTADIVRVVLILVCFGLAASYYLTSGKSLLLNYSPWWMNPRALEFWWRGPQYLTLEELALFNGTDPELPIFLAINGTIFDVTEGSRTYGPGGSYSAFAGKDATRAFVTGCFAEDATGDLRGAEEVYLPIEDLAEEEGITSREKKLRAEREKREAKKRVLQAVQGWEDFYQKNAKYIEVGKVVGTPTVYEGPAPTLCEQAQQGRPKRSKIRENEAKKAEKDGGKPVP